MPALDANWVEHIVQELVNAHDKAIIVDLYYFDLDAAPTIVPSALRLSNRAFALFDGAVGHPGHSAGAGSLDDLTAESFSNMPYDPLIIKVPNISRKIDGRLSVGNVVIDNTLGFMNDKLNYRFVFFSMYLINIDKMFSTMSAGDLAEVMVPLVVLGRVEGVVSGNNSQVVLRVGDMRDEYAKAKINKFTCTGFSTADDPNPVIVGDVFNIPTVVKIEGTTVRYHYAQTLPSGGTSTLKYRGVDTGLKPGGGALAVQDTNACSSGIGDPIDLEFIGKFTYTNNNESDVHTVNITGLTYTTSQAFDRLGLLTKVPIDSVNNPLDYDTLVPYKVGILTNTNDTFGSVADKLANSGGGIWFVDETQTVVLKFINDPIAFAGTVKLEIFESEIIGMKLARIEPPAREITLKYDRNYNPLAGEDLVQIDTVVPGGTPAAKTAYLKKETDEWSTVRALNTNIPETITGGFSHSNEDLDRVIETYLIDSTEAQTEVNRRSSARDRYRKVLKFTIPFSTTALDIGDVVRINHTNFVNGGVQLGTIIGYNIRPIAGLMDLEVWL